MKNFEGSEAYHQCDVVRKTLLRAVSEVIQYSWDTEFKMKNILSADSALMDSVNYSQIDITELSSTEMDLLGFGTFNQEMKERLIPLWLLPYIKTGIIATSIMGNKEPLSPNFRDKDHRFGCMAWGVLPKDKNKS